MAHDRPSPRPSVPYNTQISSRNRKLIHGVVTFSRTIAFACFMLAGCMSILTREWDRATACFAAAIALKD